MFPSSTKHLPSRVEKGDVLGLLQLLGNITLPSHAWPKPSWRSFLCEDLRPVLSPEPPVGSQHAVLKG